MQRTRVLAWLLISAFGHIGYVTAQEDVFFGKTLTIKPCKKRILILTSTGGGGHMSATQAITAYLENSYEIRTAQVFGEVFKSFDPIHYLTFEYAAAEDFYNWLISYNLSYLINIYSFVGKCMVSMFHDSLVEAVEQYIHTHPVDMVISVVPFVNHIILEAVKRVNIPLLMIPTDLDAHTFVTGMDTDPKYKKFHYFMSFDDDSIRDKISTAPISNEQITVSGFPIKPSFFERKDRSQIKKDFNIPEGKQVVMVLMGAAGSRACFKYVRRLTKGKTPMHIVACIGRSEDLRSKIAGLRVPPHISISTVGFTQRIADLMSVADLLITKPGSMSFCEALYMNVPILLDNIYGELEWEALNLSITKKYGFGDIVTSYRQLNPLVSKYLTDEQYSSTIRNNVASFPKGDFAKNLRNTVYKLINNTAF